ELLDHLRRIGAAAVDAGGVDLLAEEALHLAVEGLELLPLVEGFREGVDESQAKIAEEEITEEAVPLPGLARRFGHFQRFGFVHCHTFEVGDGAEGWHPCRASSPSALPARSASTLRRRPPGGSVGRTMRTAMLIVGVQNDFCTGGAREIVGGERVAAPLSCVASAIDHGEGLI